MKNNLKILMGILILIMLVSNVSAFMPPSHLFIFDEGTKTPIESDFYKDCMKYPDLCYAGNSLVDSAVIWYYTQRGKYTTTHSPSFCSKLIQTAPLVPGHDADKMMACAIGGCTHQPADIPSHSLIGNMDGMVTYSIKHSFLANSIIHVFAEQHEDNWITSQDTYLKSEMESRLPDAYSECKDLFVLAMLGESSYQGMSKVELDKVFDTYITEVLNSQTGYDTGFKNKSLFVTLKSIPLTLLAIYITIMVFFFLVSLLLFLKIVKRNAKIRHWIALIVFLPIFLLLAYLFWGSLNGSAFKTFVGVIKPISNLVPIGEPKTWSDLAIKNTQQFLTQGETWLDGTDASGFGGLPVLEEASASVLIYDYIALGILILGLALWLFYLFKKNKIKTGEFNF